MSKKTQITPQEEPLNQDTRKRHPMTRKGCVTPCAILSYVQKDIMDKEQRISMVEQSIQKLTELSQNITVLLTQHTEQIKQGEKNLEQQHNDFAEYRKNMADEIKEITREIKEMEKRLGERFDAQFKVIAEQEKEKKKEDASSLELLTSRIGKLEKRWWMITGGVGVAMLLINNREWIAHLLGAK